MPLINCEINVILTWSANCVIIYDNAANQNPTFEITETKIHVPVANQLNGNAKSLPQIKSGFQRTINRNRHLSKPELLVQNPNLTNSVDQVFKEKTDLFVLAQRTSNKRYYLPNVEIKNYNVIIDGKKLFD